MEKYLVPCKILIISAFFLMVANVRGKSVEATSSCDFKEVDGIVVIEAESLPVSDRWYVNSDSAGYSGSGYMVWLGWDYFSDPGNATIEVNIDIQKTGTYRFVWRTKVGYGTSTTDNNDTWLRFPDVGLFFAKKNDGHIVYPKGSGMQPTANGAGSDNWFKVFCSGTLDWTWLTRTSDNDAHYIYVRFDEAGLYKMQISPRSNDHMIDRIVLFHEDVSQSQALDMENEETVCGLPTALDEEIQHSNNGLAAISVFPNPSKGDISFSYSLVEPGKVSLEVYNIIGQVVKSLISSESRQAGSYKERWDCRSNDGTTQPAGIYLYRLKVDQETVGIGKIMLTK